MIVKKWLERLGLEEYEFETSLDVSLIFSPIGLGFELRALCLLGRCCAPWVIFLSFFFIIHLFTCAYIVWVISPSCPSPSPSPPWVIFQIESYVYASWPGPPSSYLGYLHSWDDNCVSLWPDFFFFNWLRWGIVNILAGLTFKLWFSHSPPPQ
jgi:hypothetical protein